MGSLIEIANYHVKSVFDVPISKLGVLRSWWPFMASNYFGKISISRNLGILSRRMRLLDEKEIHEINSGHRALGKVII